MTARIVLFGATGYTGRRTAGSMVARGLTPVLAGRDPARLAAVAAELGGLETVAADVTDSASVAALVGRGDVLVTTVGPFTALGRPAVDAAIRAGAVYLDSTGEPPFIKQVFERMGPAAERGGAALIPAFGNDFVPGVLAGALALRAAGNAATRVDVGYFLTGARGQVFSRGTFSSLGAVGLAEGYAWREGALRAEPTGVRMRTFDVEGRPLPGVTIGASEHFALPRLAPGLRTVDVYLGWFGPASGAVRAMSGVVPLLRKVPGAERVVSALTGAASRLVAAAPNPAALDAVTSHFVAEAFDAGGTLLARTRLTSPEAYAITADLLAWGAGRAAEHGVLAHGALDPVAAFGLGALIDGAKQAGIVEVA